MDDHDKQTGDDDYQCPRCGMWYPSECGCVEPWVETVVIESTKSPTKTQG